MLKNSPAVAAITFALAVVSGCTLDNDPNAVGEPVANPEGSPGGAAPAAPSPTEGTSEPGQPPGPPPIPLPGGEGWTRLPNTKFSSKCPSTVAFGNCGAVTAAWGGAAFDTTHNRLIVWGGGHGDYSGNEVYALNMNNQTVARLTDPSTNVPSACGVSATADGRPTSRHTYNQLAYLPGADRMFVFGGASAPCGFMLGDTWTLDLAPLGGTAPGPNPWKAMSASGTPPSADFGRPAVYDPDSQKTYLRDDYYLYAYTYAAGAGTYARLGSAEGMSDYKTATIDTKRHRYILQVMGQGLFSYDISAGSSYAMAPLSTTNGGAIVNADGSEGFVYDPTHDQIVAWKGGNTVYLLNMTTNVWTTKNFPGGPSALANGTYGRFAYVPASDVFVVVNAMDDDAFILRL